MRRGWWGTPQDGAHGRAEAWPSETGTCCNASSARVRSEPGTISLVNRVFEMNNFFFKTEVSGNLEACRTDYRLCARQITVTETTVPQSR